MNDQTYRQAVDPTPLTPEFRLLELDQNATALVKEILVNGKMGSEKLHRKVLEGRNKQFELSKHVQERRLEGGTEEALSQVVEERRLYHISTILARAELLTRADQESMSQYSGDEAKFDNLTILERAQGFMAIEAGDTLSADDRATLQRYATALEAAEERLKRIDY